MTAVVVAVLLLAAAAAASVPIVRWWSDRRHDSIRHPPPLFVPIRLPDESVEDIPIVSRASRPVPVASEVQIPVSSVAKADERRPTDDSFAPTETIRFRRPVEEPVQLLPGRLEVLAGDSHHREIRFVRIPGEPMQLILGRESGPSPQYVALRSGTVSRRHARLAFSNGRWAVANLSKTNPVVVNDEELSYVAGERSLDDGDRLELGEVVLRFHSR